MFRLHISCRGSSFSPLYHSVILRQMTSCGIGGSSKPKTFISHKTHSSNVRFCQEKHFLGESLSRLVSFNQSSNCRHSHHSSLWPTEESLSSFWPKLWNVVQVNGVWSRALDEELLFQPVARTKLDHNYPITGHHGGNVSWTEVTVHEKTGRSCMGNLSRWKIRSALSPQERPRESDGCSCQLSAKQIVHVLRSSMQLPTGLLLTFQ